MTHQAEYDHKAINIGLLGYGFMGRVHSHAYAVISHLFPELTGVPRLYAVAGLGENELKQFAKQFGYVRYSSCWEQVVNDPEVDAIDICLPEHLHEEVCIAALEAGKHVLCEKPLALSLAEAQRIIEKAATVNVKTMCGFNYRFLPAVRLARDLIQQGKLGRVYMVRGHYCQESGHDPNRPAEQVRYAWGARQLGSIRGLGSHLIDTVRFLVGDAVSVNALLHTFVPERKTSNHESYAVKADEFATLQVEFSNDVVGVLTTTGMATGR
jgi:predicted dehydrogenase